MTDVTAAITKRLQHNCSVHLKSANDEPAKQQLFLTGYLESAFKNLAPTQTECSFSALIDTQAEQIKVLVTKSNVQSEEPVLIELPYIS